MPASNARVVIIVVPRERYTGSVEALDLVYEETAYPFDLVYLDGNAPTSMAERLRRRASDHGFVLERHDRMLSPNAARNRGIELAREHFPDHEYVAFLDNDVAVTHDWLRPLVEALDETGASVVAPLTLQGKLERREIHIAGGYMAFEGEAGRRTLHTDHRFQGSTVDELDEELERTTCDFAEFHAMLVRRETLDRLGPLDEELLNCREHLDFCLAVVADGGSVIFEPRSEVSYTGPAAIRTGDLRFYRRRWSDEWTKASLSRFIDKHDLDPAYLDRVGISRGRRRYALRLWAKGQLRRNRSPLTG